MLPYLHLGFASIPMYSLMVILGALAFVIMTIYIIEKKEKKDKAITNRILIISALGFAFLVFSAFVFNSLFHSIDNGKITVGGISWLGGVLGAFPVMVVLLHKLCPKIKGEALEYFNLLVPGITLAHAFGRMGCFCGGCCYGKVTDSFLGVRFPEGSLAAKEYTDVINGGSLPVLPTQLFEAIFDVLLVIVMISMYRRFKGIFIETFCFSYGTFRFFLELLRGDSRGSTGMFLTPSQLMSIILIIYGVLVILYKKGKIFKKLSEKMKYYVEHRDDNTESSASVEEKLTKLKVMLDQKLISEEEYQEYKKKLMEQFIS